MNPLSQLSGLPAAFSAPLPSAELRGLQAAREFESYLIGSLLESLEKTFATVPGENNVAGEDNYNYLGAHAIAGAIAQAGGLGIAKLLVSHLDPHESRGPNDANGSRGEI